MPSKAHLIGIFLLELTFLTILLYLRYKEHVVMQKESHVYLTRAWDTAYEKTPVTLDEIKTAIQEIQLSEVNPAAFWVGIIDEKEYTLKVSSDLSLIGNISTYSNKKMLVKARAWQDVEGLYELFLNRRFKELSNEFDQLPKLT